MDILPKLADAFSEYERKGWKVAVVVLNHYDVEKLREANRRSDQIGVFDDEPSDVTFAHVRETFGRAEGQMWGAYICSSPRVPVGYVRIYTELTNDHCIRLEDDPSKLNEEQARYRDWISGVPPWPPEAEAL